MPLRSGILNQTEQDRVAGTGPQRVYFIEESAGVYVPATGSIGEADAYLMEESADVFVLTDTASEEDRVAYAVSSTTVII